MRSSADSDVSSPETTPARRASTRTPRPPADATAENPNKEDYTQTHILPLHLVRIVISRIVRLGVVPIVVALLVLVLRPRGLGGTL